MIKSSSAVQAMKELIAEETRKQWALKEEEALKKVLVLIKTEKPFKITPNGDGSVTSSKNDKNRTR